MSTPRFTLKTATETQRAQREKKRGRGEYIRNNIYSLLSFFLCVLCVSVASSEGDPKKRAPSKTPAVVLWKS
jgi:hypothetical protein